MSDDDTEIMRETNMEASAPSFDDLPPRAQKALVAVGIDSMDAAATMSDTALMSLDGFGPKALNLVKAYRMLVQADIENLKEEDILGVDPETVHLLKALELRASVAHQLLMKTVEGRRKIDLDMVDEAWDASDRFVDLFERARGKTYRAIARSQGEKDDVN